MPGIIPTGRLKATCKSRSGPTAVAQPQPVITVYPSPPRRALLAARAQYLLMNYALGH